MQFNLADLFECVADAAPDRMALIAGETRLSYRQLDERSNRLAHHLAASGNRPGDWIGILAQNRAEWIESMLGAYKLRAAPINLNFRYVDEELRYVLDDADLVTLVFERRFAPRLLRIRSDLPKLRHFLYLEDGSGEDVSALGAVSYETALAAASNPSDFQLQVKTLRRRSRVVPPTQPSPAVPAGDDLSSMLPQ